MSTEPQEPSPLCHCECCAAPKCDPRIEKVMISRHAYNAGFLSPQQEWESAKRFVAALDTADELAGYVRIKLNDETEKQPTKGATMNRTTEETAASNAKLYGTTDAMVWAVEWCKIARELRAEGTDVIDEGIMVGWFANAFAVAVQRGWPERTS